MVGMTDPVSFVVALGVELAPAVDRAHHGSTASAAARPEVQFVEPDVLAVDTMAENITDDAIEHDDSPQTCPSCILYPRIGLTRFWRGFPQLFPEVQMPPSDKPDGRLRISPESAGYLALEFG